MQSYPILNKSVIFGQEPELTKTHKILGVGCDDLLKELTGCFWSAVADLLPCMVKADDEEDMSGQAMVGQAVPGTLASGNGK